jgi:hypothetical protein
MAHHVELEDRELVACIRIPEKSQDKGGDHTCVQQEDSRQRGDDPRKRRKWVDEIRGGYAADPLPNPEDVAHKSAVLLALVLQRDLLQSALRVQRALGVWVFGVWCLVFVVFAVCCLLFVVFGVCGVWCMVEEFGVWCLVFGVCGVWCMVEEFGV